MRWNIEIKDTNDPELYEEISTNLWKIIQEYELEEQVLIASFNHDIIEMVLQASEGEALVSGGRGEITKLDRKSTRLNSSHVAISYAVFCLKKKTKEIMRRTI